MDSEFQNYEFNDFLQLLFTINIRSINLKSSLIKIIFKFSRFLFNMKEWIVV